MDRAEKERGIDVNSLTVNDEEVGYFVSNIQYSN